MRFLLVIVAVLFGFFFSGCLAANETVTVGVGGSKFTPNSITINVGDTITFVKQNSGDHNVHEPNSNLFICATQCGFGVSTCAGCSPTTTTWTQEVTWTFPNGTFTLQCDFHASFGMTMTVKVLPEGVPIPTSSTTTTTSGSSSSGTTSDTTASSGGGATGTASTTDTTASVPGSDGQPDGGSATVLHPFALWN
jgi:plastocyanin